MNLPLCGGKGERLLTRTRELATALKNVAVMVQGRSPDLTVVTLDISKYRKGENQ